MDFAVDCKLPFEELRVERGEGSENNMKGNGEFAAFRVLWNSIPLSEASEELICNCLNNYMRKSGKSVLELEKVLATYKLERWEQLEK